MFLGVFEAAATKEKDMFEEWMIFIYIYLMLKLFIWVKFILIT